MQYIKLFYAEELYFQIASQGEHRIINIDNIHIAFTVNQSQL